ncbi:MAG: hypothetical protein PVJ86_12185 [Phycisphaerales bacterium]|jgi:hypothetical protein
MFKIVLLALALMFRFEMGHVAYYAEDVMERVVAVRQAGWTAGDLPVELPPVIGFVARPHCNEIGDMVWLYHESEGLKGPYLVADCCNELEGHCQAMQRKGIVVEVDHNTARRWGVLGLGPKCNYVAVIGLARD